MSVATTSLGTLRQWRDLPRLAAIDFVLTGLLVLATATTLWSHWRDNPDLSHGYFMPVVFVYLLLEARRGTPRFVSSGRALTAGVAALLLIGVIALAASGLYAATLEWSHALVALTLTLALVAYLGAALLVAASDEVRALPLNWPAIVAVGLWLLSAPIPPGTYSQFSLGLQLRVTEAVLRALHLLGVAALRSGNVIELASTSVGVEEACSGVRSLISCVFAGLLFSATLVRRPWARAAIILAAGPLALAMNFVRSLILTLMANAGVDIAGKWHDATGFAVLGVTAVLLAGAALLLERQNPAEPPRTLPTAAPAAPRPRRLDAPPLLLGGGLVTAFALIVFFVGNTRPSTRSDRPVPNLAAILPAQFDGWRVETARDLYQFSSTLHTPHLAQRTYLRRGAKSVEQLTVYLAYWRAGQAPVSLVAAHTPDACWPGSGWTTTPLPQTRVELTVAGRALADAEARFFKNHDYPQYVWFWHLYDGRPIEFRDPYSAKRLLAIAWQYGFTHQGDQLFVRISSNRPWDQFAAEPLVAAIFARLQPLGL